MPALFILEFCMTFEKDLEKITKNLETLELFINNGDDITLPLRSISLILENLKEVVENHSVVLENQKQILDKINAESIKARNQIVYMFLAILVTLIGKLFIHHLLG